MPTFSGRIVDRQIIFLVWVSIQGKNEGPKNLRSYSALLDTGAQGTMISEKVVTEVGLEADGFRSIIPVTGDPVRRPKYRIQLTIPITTQVSSPDGKNQKRTFQSGKTIEVALLPYTPTNHDVLLGMDFLMSFHFTMYNDQFILSN